MIIIKAAYEIYHNPYVSQSQMNVLIFPALHSNDVFTMLFHELLKIYEYVKMIKILLTALILTDDWLLLLILGAWT